MYSPSNKKILFYSVISAGSIIFVFTVILLLQFSQTPEKIIEEAAALIENWKLEEAEKSLKEITSARSIPEGGIQLYLRTLLLRGKYSTAEELFNKHFAKNKNNSTEVLLEYAAVNHFMGNIPKSDSLCNAVIQDSMRARSLKNVSSALNILGLNKFFIAQYDSALLLQQKSLTAARSAKSLQQEANALRQIGVLEWYKGNLDSAFHNYYEPALKIYKAINDKQGEATTLSDIGLLYFDWKNWTKEFFYQMKALKIRIEIGDLMGIADSYNFFEHFPKLTKELELLKYGLISKSYKISKELGYKWGMETASNSLQQFFRRNYDLFGNFTVSHDSISYTSAEAKLLQLQNDLFFSYRKDDQKEIIKINKEILRVAASIGYAVIQCNSLINLANIYIKNNRIEDASEALEKAIQLSKSSTEPKFNFAAIDILKEKLEFKKRNRQRSLSKLKTLAHYYDSLYIAESKLASNDMEWQSSLYSIYNLRNLTYSVLIDLLYEANEYEELLEYSTKERSLIYWHNFTGRFKVNETGFVNLFGKLTSIESNDRGDLVIDSLLTLFQNLLERENQRIKTISKLTVTLPALQSISSLQKKMGDDEIYIEFSEGEDHFYAAGITNENTIVKRIPIPKSELKSLIIFFRKTIERGKWYPNDKTWIKPAQLLYNTLLKTVLNEKVFNHKNTIILSPCNILHQVPFAALILTPSIDSDKLKLIDMYSIKYSYSRGDYLKYLENPAIKLNSFLAFVPDNEELKFSEREISLIPSSLFKIKKIFNGNHATQQNFLANAYNSDVIHIASHSNVDLINPLQSKIKLSNGDLELFDFYRYNITADMIVLSSCESGMSVGSIEDIPTSLDMLSFPKALLSNGTKCVLSTLWAVDDYSTSEIISKFYRNVLSKKDKKKFDLSKSLSTSIREFILSQKEKKHPFYWAPFIISN